MSNTKLPARDVQKSAEEQGLFNKFHVERTDGSSEPGGKHHGCNYFVLDVDHDKHAKAALTAYANEVEDTHPILAREMRENYGLADRERQAGEAVADQAEVRLIAQNIREFAQELSLEFETGDLERAADLLESLASQAVRADSRPNSVEASAMMDSVLAEYGWPANPKNAARAGFEACRRMLAAAPSPDGKAEQAEAPSEIEAKELWDCLCRLTNLRIGHHVMSAADRPDADQWLCIQFNSFVEADGMRKALKNWHEAARAKFKPDVTQPTASNAGEREEFEAWSLTYHEHVDEWTGARYRSDVWEDMWLAFQAGRAALATKPPAGEQKPVGYIDKAVPWLRSQDEAEMSVGFRRTRAPGDIAVYIDARSEQANGFGPKLVPQVSGFTQPPAGEQKPVGVVRLGTEPWNAGCSVVDLNAPLTVGTLVYASTPPEQVAQDSERVRLLTEVEATGEGLRYSLDCLVNNGVNTFRVCDEEENEYLGDDWVLDPVQAIDEAIRAARARGEGERS